MLNTRLPIAPRLAASLISALALMTPLIPPAVSATPERPGAPGSEVAGVLRTSRAAPAAPGRVTRSAAAGSVLVLCEQAVYGVAYSPKGDLLVAACRDDTIRAWSVPEYEVLWTVNAEDDRCGQVSFTPGGLRLLVAHNDGWEIRRAVDGALECVGTNPSGRGILGAWTSSSSYFGTDFGTLYDVDDPCGFVGGGAPLPSGHGFERAGHLDFSDAAGLAAACSDEGDLFVWNALGSLERQIPLAAGNAYDTDFSTEGDRLAAVGFNAVKIFDTATWAAEDLFPTLLADDLVSVAFVGGDAKLAVGDDLGGIELFDVATGASLDVFEVEGAALEMSWNPATSQLAVSTSLGQVHVLEPLGSEDLIPPAIEDTSVDPSQAPPGTLFTIESTISDESGVGSATVFVRDPGGALVATLPMTPASPTLWSATWDSTGATAGVHAVDVEAIDASPAQNAALEEDAAFFEVLACASSDPTCDGIDDDCDGQLDENAPLPDAASGLTLASDAQTLSWPAQEHAEAYDLLRGNLSTLLQSAGDFSGAVDACIADNLAATQASDPSKPPPGAGFFYLVRSVGCLDQAGTYAGPAGKAERDASIAQSPLACP